MAVPDVNEMALPRWDGSPGCWRRPTRSPTTLASGIFWPVSPTISALTLANRTFIYVSACYKSHHRAALLSVDFGKTSGQVFDRYYQPSQRVPAHMTYTVWSATRGRISFIKACRSYESRKERFWKHLRSNPKTPESGAFTPPLTFASLAGLKSSRP